MNVKKYSPNFKLLLSLLFFQRYKKIMLNQLNLVFVVLISSIIIPGYVESLNCAYCGLEKFCPVPFDKSSVSTIQCEKSCMKFDGFTTDNYRLIVRSCGFFDADECRTNSEYEDATAVGTTCQCKSDWCNGSRKFKSNYFIMSAILIIIFIVIY